MPVRLKYAACFRCFENREKSISPKSDLFNFPTTGTIYSIIGGNAQNVDFGRKDDAANTINKVVAEETDDNIKNVVSGDDFNKDIKLAVVYGLTFMDSIKKLFSSDDTVTGPFTEASKTVDIEYLFQEEVYNYAESSKLNSQVLELPLESIYTAYIIFPEADADVSCIIDKLGKYKILDSVIDSLNPTLVDLYFPKFNTFTTTIDSKNIAEKNLDIPSLFDPNIAQLQDVIEDNKDVSISFGTQELLFTSDLNLGSASASDPSDDDDSDDLPSVELQLNRPFIFLITISIDSQILPVICGYRATAN